MTVAPEHVEGDRWRVRVYVGTDPRNGRPIQRSRYFRATGPRQAKKLAAEHEATLRREAERTKSEQGTVKQAVDLWVKHRDGKDSPATVYRRASIVDAIRTGLGHHRLDDLRPLHIDQWYDQLRAEDVGQGATPRFRSESTIHHYHRVLHAILKQAYDWEMTDRTPAARVKPPKHRRPKINPPTPDAVRVVISDASPDLTLGVRLLVATGMRRGELAALRWTDVDLEAGTLNITKTLVAIPGAPPVVKAPKTEESVRVVRLDDVTVYELDRHLRRQRSVMTQLADDAYLLADPLSEDRTGRSPRSPDWISRAWKRQCARHGATIRLHDLRHGHITWLMNSGVPVPAIARRAGHARMSTTTDVYGHADAADDLLAAQVIGRTLGPAAS